jgi:hypothetical protein
MDASELLIGVRCCRSALARDRPVSLFLGLHQEPKQELSSRPSGGPSYFSLLAQREVTKRKGTPASRPPGILPCGYAIGLRGFADSASCAARTRVAPPWRRDHAPARGAEKELRKRHCAPIPCVAPSNAAADRGKARMFERMDARVRAGRSVASSAGHRCRAAAAARQSGRLLFGYFLLARQEKVTRAGRRPDRNALELASTQTNNQSETKHTGRGHGPLLQEHHHTTIRSSEPHTPNTPPARSTPQ